MRNVVTIKLEKPLRNIMQNYEESTEISQILLWLAPQKSKMIQRNVSDTFVPRSNIYFSSEKTHLSYYVSGRVVIRNWFGFFGGLVFFGWFLFVFFFFKLLFCALQQRSTFKTETCSNKHGISLKMNLSHSFSLTFAVFADQI